MSKVFTQESSDDEEDLRPSICACLTQKRNQKA